jgi:hypothetical protein
LEAIWVHQFAGLSKSVRQQLQCGQYKTKAASAAGGCMVSLGQSPGVVNGGRVPCEDVDGIEQAAEISFSDDPCWMPERVAQGDVNVSHGI